MGVEFTLCEDFLAHLVAAKTIDETQAEEALNKQRTMGKTIGHMALDDGILTMPQVFEILDHQSETGGLFGEIAIEKGFMTEPQITYLLRVQKEIRPSIGLALLELGYVTVEALHEEQRAYLHKIEIILV